MHLCNIEKANILCATLSQTVQVLGLSIAGGCGLFLLGNYGVQGNFNNDTEEFRFMVVMVGGNVILLVTSIWKGLVIRREIKRDEENAAAGVSGEQGGAQEGAQAQDPPVTKLSSVFVGLGVMATTVEVGLIFAKLSVGGDYYRTAQLAFLPIAILLYLISLFAQPGRHNGRTELFLRAHFVSFAWVGEGAYILHTIKWDMMGYALIHLGRALLLNLLFTMASSSELR